MHQAAEGKDSGGKMVVGIHNVADTEVIITWQSHIQGLVIAFTFGTESVCSIVAFQTLR